MIILLAILGYLVLLAIGLSLSAAAKRGDSMIAKIEWQPGRADAAEAPEDSPCDPHTGTVGATTGGEQAVMTREEACLDWFGGAVEPFCLMGANEEILLRDSFLRVAQAMSDDDWEAFSDRSPKLLVQTGARASAAPLYVWPRPGRDRTEVWILHFAAECLELPDPTSIVAHECAHVVAGHTHIGEPNAKEREADAITMRWGFGAQGNAY